uniref:NB-ARC domain-containing protein n=1 Tax=Oryza brachyantha TaxID=4533 RepID=J3NAG7_ORYBR
MAEAVIVLAAQKIGVALGKEAINQAASYFETYVTQLTDLQGRMARIRTELRVMHEYLSGIDVRSHNKKTYEVWVEEVRMQVHRIEDIVDDYLHLIGHKHDTGWCSSLKKRFKRPNILLSLNRIVSSIKEAETNLDHLFKTKDRWVSVPNEGDTSGENSSYIVERSRHLADISRSLHEDDLVGVDGNINLLHRWITTDDMRRKVIMLHGGGMGGLGKTALAANVYNKEKANFECYAWVSISQAYTMMDVLKRLNTELYSREAKNSSVSDNIDDLGHRLEGFLNDRKYLIVFDDVWEPATVDELLRALVPNDRGSRVLMTTRIHGVAHHALSDMRIEIQPLSPDDSLMLFQKTAFPREDNTIPAELTTLVDELVGKCKGIPLAIVSVGRLLRDNTEAEFRRIHNQLDWELNNNRNTQDVRNILYLSYIYLPTYLKNCFLYCSLFPENYHFKRKKLIRWWIAEGFVEKRGGRTMEKVAEDYLKELVYWKMLQLVRSNSFDRIKIIKMHGLVRELAVDMCQKECFGVVYNDKAMIHGESPGEKDERRIVIHRINWDVDPDNLGAHVTQKISGAHHIRSLILEEDNRTPQARTLVPVVVKCRYVSVLELSGLSIDNVPNAIGDLFNLRHLGLRGSKVKVLPSSIERLSNLLTLDLTGSELQELPRGIVKLTKLRHLFAEKVSDKYGRDLRCRTGVRIPNGIGMEKLRELQTLQALELRNEGSLRHLKEMRQMRSLRITGVRGSYCEALCVSLSQMKMLSNLDIIASDSEEFLQLSNNLNPLPADLEKLSLRGRLAQPHMLLGATAATTTGGQNHLCSLHLSWSRLEDDPLLSLSRWSTLTRLSFTRAYVGQQLVFLQGWFTNLKKLILRDMPNLDRLEIQQGTMTRIQKIVLQNLSGMVLVPRGIEYVQPTLKSLLFLDITPVFFAELRNC